MVATGSEKAKRQCSALAGVTAALAMFGAAQGLSSPLFTLLMQKQGMSPALIGLSAAMMPLGLILSASFVPATVRLVGARVRRALHCPEQSGFRPPGTYHHEPQSIILQSR